MPHRRQIVELHDGFHPHHEQNPKPDPAEVLKRYEKWKDIAHLSGPFGLKQIKGFHDEALKGQWRNHRSGRLGRQWRMIYQVAGQGFLIKVVEVYAHDYEKK